MSRARQRDAALNEVERFAALPDALRAAVEPHARGADAKSSRRRPGCR